MRDRRRDGDQTRGREAHPYGAHATRATIEALEHDPRLHEGLFTRGIRQCLDLTYAAAAGQAIWEYAPQSRGAADYAALLDVMTASADGASQTVYGQVEKAQTVV